ncbi:CBS domain-containing protein [Deltaproteobacteria bacterium]|nr:CBS domain-containing protein [Deltaproteobacteria bacterium]
MKCKTVEEILLPFRDGIRIDPSVTLGDKIIYAIEMMLNNNLKEIAVVRRERTIGMVTLEDALRVLGLNVPPKNDPG